MPQSIEGESESGTESARWNSKVYVGGFLVLYDEHPAEEHLRLPRSLARKNLPTRSLPINVNHDDRATVGRVYRLFDTEKGIFCLGEIQSQSFLEIVAKAATHSHLIHQGPDVGLKPDPVLEYLSTGFPAFSLSNVDCGLWLEKQKVVDTQTNVEVDDNLDTSVNTKDFFRHVAICGVGRRRGTLAIYGRDPKWIVTKFTKTLTTVEREQIEKWIETSWCDVQSENRCHRDPFDSDSYGLLANSVDTAYIRERFPKLEYDKKILGLDYGTYIKASETPSVSNKKTTNLENSPERNVDVITIKPSSLDSNQIKPNTGTEQDVSFVAQKTDSSVKELKIMAQNTTPVPVTSGPYVTPTTLPGITIQPQLTDGIYLSKDALLSLLHSVNGKTTSTLPLITTPSGTYTSTTGTHFPIGPPPPPPPPMYQTGYSGLQYPPPVSHHTLPVPYYNTGYDEYGRGPPGPVAYHSNRMNDSNPDGNFNYPSSRPYPSRSGSPLGRYGSYTKPRGHSWSHGRDIRKRRYSDSDSVDVEDGGMLPGRDEVSFPGDVDYPTSSQTQKRSRKTELSSGQNGAELQMWGILQETLQALRHDLRQRKMNESTVSEESSRPETQSASSSTVLGTESAVLDKSSGQQIPQPQTNKPNTKVNTTGLGSSTPVPRTVVNASCLPESKPLDTNLLTVNKRLFVRALNKID